MDEVDRMIADRAATALAAIDRVPLDPPVRVALADLATAAAWRAG